MSTVGNRIKSRRIELGITVDELAAKLGKNRATVYRYESNDIENMPIEVIEPLARALHTTPAAIMGWEEMKPATEIDDGSMEIVKIFTELSQDNRAKLLELSHLFLDAQRKSEETQ